MPKLITLTIDGQVITVPEGTLVVNAAKQIGIDIPVFCYHPKMEPVGMCRMCLVDVGRPVVDRATGQVVLEPDGSPKIGFGPKLETSCTLPVTEGMVIVTTTAKVMDARKDVVEFLLTSHPLDCPVCDKGGECPLQNLTMRYGPGSSRFEYSDKKHLAKNVPLGELIWLDRERCIQCGRCVRFQHEIVDEPVIDFYQRGRSLEIITRSEPGFDSIFSGNTTDICPVGALTTADFRFGARPWEMNVAASICTHCAVGCNLALNVRREAKAGGGTVIKRVLPRQNEGVNEIWICDKGRLGYHYAESAERLTQPMVRKDGKLVPATWDEALETAANGLAKAGDGLVSLAGGRLSNEDLFTLKALTDARGGKAILNSVMAGGDLMAEVGVAPGTNLGTLGKGDAIIVVACDLHQEAPIWWLRIKQATERGATLIVVNPRDTRLEEYATHSVRYAYGSETATLAQFLPEQKAPAKIGAIAKAFAEAENAIIVYGSEGLGVQASQTLAEVAAQLLRETKHFGTPNNGLMAAWQAANTQGAFELGWQPSADLAGALNGANALIIAAADPAGDEPALAKAIKTAKFVVVQELFLTETAKLADVVLPAQAFTERDGTLTSGERRVQRYYPAVPVRGEARADFAITAALGEKMGVALEGRAATVVFRKLAQTIPAFAGLTYQALAEVAEQTPIIGRSDVYYGGTTYDNHQGLGVTLPLSTAKPVSKAATMVSPISVQDGEVLVVPFTRLLDQGTTIAATDLLVKRLVTAEIWLHPNLADKLGIKDTTTATIELSDKAYSVVVKLDDTLPADVVLAPRSTGLPITQPMPARVRTNAPVNQ